MKRRVIGTIGVLLLIVLAYQWGKHSGASRVAPQTPETVAEPPKAEKEKKEEPAPAAKQKGAVAEPAAKKPEMARPARPQEPTAEGEQEPPPTAPEPPAASGPLQLLKRVYARQSTDAGAREVERQIRSFFGTEYLPAETFRSVTCRAGVCKIDMVWSKQFPLAHMALAMKLAEQMTSSIALEPAPEPDRRGDLRLELYVVRAGYTLADLE